MSDIVVVGSLNMDTVISVPHIPEAGETILATDINYYSGGKGANQAVVAARLGNNVSMIGKIGQDGNGQSLLESLEKDNIDTTGIEISDSITGTAFINVNPDGENNIVVAPGANDDVDIKQIEKYRSIIENSKVCILQMEIPYETVKYVIDICYKKGVKVIFNPAPATNQIEDEIIRKIDILVPNETELFILAGKRGLSLDNMEDVAREVYNKGCPTLIVTLGSQGGMYLKDNKLEYFKSKRVKVLDTTAAGDAFIGAIGTNIVQGKSIEESIEYATYVAALTVTKSGAQSSLPTKKEVEEFVDKCSKVI